MTAETLYWDFVESRFGHFAAWVDDAGRLVRFDLDNRAASSRNPPGVHKPKALADIRKQIREYDAGKRQVFEVERAPTGTAFQHAVWDALWEIPFGETTSYGAMAKGLGLVNGARAVGLANGSNPIGLIVPCHRVIGADGSLTGYGGGLPLKRALLEHEARVIGMPMDLFA
ncbi:MAG: methylated-DNA--[protein]-cysteine S-methyltransferase [Alphaproteobacteria bacterium]|jgi:methylated-DNA-[protein]-cysteine S-methyltransferase|nr:methylated-DNA--[protein]-cysteine S-methyltransferase [Alphaproteobacteria bacterium]OJU58223.1 MAG: hypothetical protein BGO00_01450 [Alphaproteobacteria bacterium 62-8]MBN9555963.1 methylated-DNA--[protein]-cysteine S-methyltransferase [Alphaproteobacteria bacterium]MBN9566262.1 methylated-DNA--[protein]-cysteine S-methyltransferase [Alphaproteobacteria bacterium]MBN9569705.1 methylated-DNA--[protein]-cysteine S-methyltransferase [Alphaproteobacteria bacterium]